MVDDDSDEHATCVAVWMARASDGLPVHRLVNLLDRALGAIWQRSAPTLGGVTLAAIVDRVIHTAGQRFPALGSLDVDVTGVRCDGLRESAGTLDREELGTATSFVLVELLRIVGHLTAEILTPALHAELWKVALEDGAPSREEAKGQRRARRRTKDVKS